MYPLKHSDYEFNIGRRIFNLFVILCGCFRLNQNLKNILAIANVFLVNCRNSWQPPNVYKLILFCLMHSRPRIVCWKKARRPPFGYRESNSTSVPINQCIHLRKSGIMTLESRNTVLQPSLHMRPHSFLNRISNYKLCTQLQRSLTFQVHIKKIGLT